MNNKCLYLFALLMLFRAGSINGNECPPPQNNAVSYGLTAGRLGDHLLAYLDAKWISHFYKLPLLYRPFEYADAFAFSRLEPFTLENCAQNYTRVPLEEQEDLKKIKPTDSKTLYMSSKFANVFNFDWKRDGFDQIVKKIMQPVAPVSTIELPKNKISIAVHVRKGSGKNNKLVIDAQPRRFPPDSYYLAQIRRVLQLFQGLPVYFHIFSDSPDIDKIADLYRQRIKSRKATFGFSKTSQEEADIIKDFFDLTKFDGIIRARSNFSIAASRIADYAVSISPGHAIKRRNKAIIDKVDTVINKKKIDELKREFAGRRQPSSSGARLKQEKSKIV